MTRACRADPCFSHGGYQMRGAMSMMLAPLTGAVPAQRKQVRR
jgi:hypothetical protein